MSYNSGHYNLKYNHFHVTKPAEHVAHVEINQPKTFNAFLSTTWHQYKDLILELDADPEVKCIIISGVGPHFSSGLNLQGAIEDMLGFFKGDSHGSVVTKSESITKNGDMYKHIVDFQDCIAATAQIGTPSIGVAHGISYGLAIDLLATTSIRLAVKKSTRFSIKEIDIGLVADIGSLQRMPALVNNKSRLNELALTAREFKGEEALELGFVSELADTKEQALEKALAIAKNIARHERWCIEGTKREVQFMVNGGSVNDGLDRVAIYQADHLGQEFVDGLVRLSKSMAPVKSKAKL
ncbi:hypothetical protein BABINDRAFT_163123 [Babjeviella inositovora NRRL Y-12698]|uniref:Enoyl-CoA hydratase n=1 Tax=Babjeviella inositovora NRRL Y-12698 TaxID=984486 RepID=A0A1E3QK84_9ASCO|nr:uncharacterized protein BABINDRAFT_163123 [Babjeviella inositovora NRRL Y-12698]ODQ78101.1 hypothetical protein BABINDRAFT_163123 [Babjeviella inositovora NRRL Y-12698]